ncbi:MAG: hypothetical protein JSR18_06735 [Proteobacteria bacterium]|nr:hypothetical protein [Pseudomonadota bacterium]
MAASRAPRACRLAAWALAASLAACTYGPVVPNATYKSQKVRVAPFEKLDFCLDAQEGDRIDYQFEATEPVELDIAYRDGPAVLIPWQRDPATRGSGIVPVLLDKQYCIYWQAGPAGALVSYTVVLRRRE